MTNPVDIQEKEAPPSGRTRLDLLIAFHVLDKVLKVYDPGNVLCRDHAANLFGVLKELIESKGEVELFVRHSSIYINKIRLKFSLSTYAIFKSMLEEFKKRDLAVIRFLPGLTLEETVSFMSVFSRREKKQEFSFPRFLEELEEAGVTHVVVEKARAEEAAAGGKLSTARIYFLSIIHLKECFELDRRNEPLKVNTTRRLMQSIYNHIVDNESFMLGLTSLKNYDEYTLNHSVNVCALAMALGRRLGLNRAELVDLGIAAFFHDLGKLETPVDILNKPGSLDQSEVEIIQKHPYQGAEKLVHLKDFRHLPLRTIHVAMEHHIKEDLSGYPRYFKRRDVNLFSKIVKVVDYFDAITTSRVYRKRTYTTFDALNEMLDQAGTEFNTEILKVFVNMMGIFPIGSLVALSTGEAGIVVDLNPDPKFMLRPKVKLVADAEGNRVDGEVVDLAEPDPDTGAFKRSIAGVLNPEKYSINVIDYFLSMAQQE